MRNLAVKLLQRVFLGVQLFDHSFFLFLSMIFLCLFQTGLFIFTPIIYTYKLVLNNKKSCSMVFCSKHQHPHLLDLNIVYDDDSPLAKVVLFKYLGLWVDPELVFKPHIDFIIKKKLMVVLSFTLSPPLTECSHFTLLLSALLSFVPFFPLQTFSFCH